MDGPLEVGRIEGARDEALVDAARRPEQPEGHDGEPQSPVEDGLGLAQVLEPENVDGLLDAARHVAVLIFSLVSDA